MITNERQYKITKTQVAKFEQALSDATKKPERSIHPLLRKAQEDAVRSQLFDLREDLSEYEALRSGKQKILRIESLEDLPKTLIQARIAMGLSQKDLAERIGLKEQQIQRYEATQYASASLARITEVIRALGLMLKDDILLSFGKISLTTLFERLKKVGLDRDFVTTRLIPNSLLGELEAKRQGKEIEESSLALSIASIIGRVFDWSLNELLTDRRLAFKPRRLGAVHFKTPARMDEMRMTAYTFYAHYLALLVLDVTKDMPTKPIPKDWGQIREEILSVDGSLTFKSLLLYVWRRGIAVLPLRDSGGFHGACWRVKGRSVIVLKQRVSSSARWLFDLSHEFRHVLQEPDNKDISIIEASEMATERRMSAVEQEASQFAGDLLLGGRAEELAEMCVEAANNKLEWLKSSVVKVAKKERIPVDLLANYLAFRLSLQGENWWGAANNLQSLEDDPWRIARDVFLELVEFAHINEVDRKLLMQALAD